MSKVVVVTDASAGVGRATVQEFGKQGYDVALLARGTVASLGVRRQSPLAVVYR